MYNNYYYLGGTYHEAHVAVKRTACVSPFSPSTEWTRDPTQAIRLCSKHIYTLCNLTGSHMPFLKCLFIFILCAQVFCLHVCMHMPGIHRGQKRASIPWNHSSLELLPIRSSQHLPTEPFLIKEISTLTSPGLCSLSSRTLPNNTTLGSSHLTAWSLGWSLLLSLLLLEYPILFLLCPFLLFGNLIYSYDFMYVDESKVYINPGDFRLPHYPGYL